MGIEMIQVNTYRILDNQYLIENVYRFSFKTLNIDHLIGIYSEEYMRIFEMQKQTHTSQWFGIVKRK